jgi:hypothetical protein
LLAETREGPPPDASVAPPPWRHAALASPAPHHPTDAIVRTILARPLFTPTRRPPDAPAAPDRAPQLPRLAGTIVNKTERLAILVASGETHPFVLREGATSHGLVVLAITPSRIVARSATGRVTIGLAADGARVETAPPPVIVSAPVMTKDPRSRAPNNQDE